MDIPLGTLLLPCVMDILTYGSSGLALLFAHYRWGGNWGWPIKGLDLGLGGS